jgi:predicted transcriptional regulator
MKKPDLPKPTEAELAILRVLWQRGPSTVREIWEQISPTQQTGYTTVLKTMQIMFEKGLLKRDEAQRSHVYMASVSEAKTQQQVVRHLLDRLFAGSAPKLVMQALAAKKATPADLAEIRKLLDEMEGGFK